MKPVAYKNLCIHYLPKEEAGSLAADLSTGIFQEKDDIQWAVSDNTDKSQNLHVRFRHFDKLPLTSWGLLTDLVNDILALSSKFNNESKARTRMLNTEAKAFWLKRTYIILKNTMDGTKRKPEWLENGCDYFEKHGKGAA